MSGSTPPTVGRRTVLVAGGATLGSLAGCLGGGSSGPRDRSYTLTITRSDGTLELGVEPAPEVADVIRIRVGDTVEFVVVNEAEVPVGVHNHANDAELVLEPGEEHTMRFEVTEAMTGRQTIEGWVAEGEHGETHDPHGGEETELAVVEVRPRGS